MLDATHVPIDSSRGTRRLKSTLESISRSLMTLRTNRELTLTPNASSSAALLQGVEMADIQALMEENPSLRGYVQGYLAELMLKRNLIEKGIVAKIDKIPDRDALKGDLLLDYKGVPITIEVKSLATASVKEDILNETWEGTVLVKNTDRKLREVEGIGTINATNLIKGEFDILAICCFAVTGQWDFAFMESRYLPESDDFPGFVKTRFLVNPYNTPGLTHDCEKVLESIYRQKQSSR